jgi:putative ABC transport system permease protein
MLAAEAAQDVRYALRSLARAPVFVSVAVLTLALGIGANTAIFSVVNGVLLRPLPYKNSEQFVRVMANLTATDSPTRAPFRAALSLTASEIAELQSHTRLLSDIGMASPFLLALTGAEDGARLQGARVSSSILSVLGVQALIGRVLGPSDERPGAESVVLLSHSMWQRYFAADPAVIGRTLTFDSVLGPRRQTSYAVVGVMRPGFAFPNPQTQFWMPFQRAVDGPEPRAAIVGRLSDPGSMETAAAELSPIIRSIRGHAPATTYDLIREQDALVAPVRPALLTLMAAVGFVLVIACVNVANLVLARGTARRREMAIRVALGAGRGRLIRLLLTESLMLSVAGGVAGVWLALGGISLLKYLGSTLPRVDIATISFPRLEEVRLDTDVLAFTAVISTLTGIAFGLVPALYSARAPQMDSLRESAATAHSGFGGHGHLRVRSFLVLAEVAMATMLLVGGGLLMRSFLSLLRVDPGYDSANVLTFQVNLPFDLYPEARLRTFAQDLVERLRSVPGVSSAAYANQLPMVGLRDTAGGLWKSPDPNRRGAPDAADARFVSRDYLDVMGIRVVAGRGFNDADSAGRPKVVLINRALARREFAGENPVGRLVFMGRDTVPWEIVGIVDNVRQFGLDREPEPQFFIDLRQWAGTGPLFPGGAYYAIRTSADPGATIASIRGIVPDLEARASLFYVAEMSSLVASTISRPRMYAVLLALFAGVATTLSVIGIYGVLAYSVAGRTREIGIRIALGARRSDVLKMVMGHTAALTGAGIVIGLAGAAGVTRYLRSMLFGLTPLDPITFAAVAVLFAVVAALATFLPARRAAGVDPLVALRCE